VAIRYLHVIHSLDPRGGGPAEGVKQLSRVAMKLQHRVEIATLVQPNPAWLEDYDCPVHFLGPSHLKYGYAPRLAPWLRQRAHEFAAVIVNGLWQYHGLCTWRVLRGGPVPYYVFTHGMLDPWFKQQYPLKHLKKQLYWPWAEYRVLRDARAVLFTSEEERLLARQSFSQYHVNELVVNYGVPEPGGDPTRQREGFLERFPRLRGKRILLFLGRIHPKKGCDLLIEAFASVQRLDGSLELVMAGPDQVGMQEELQQLAERLSVGKSITWAGMLSGDLKLGAFRAAEAFVLPSHQENFGIAVAESLACGTPVLISNKVNIWREIVADRAGLAAADTLDGTIELLHQWLAMSPTERHAVALNAFDCFARRFHVEAAANSILDTIQRRGAPPPLKAA
jgi:glycosyltransferase involved in cell wall biosynthesis